MATINNQAEIELTKMYQATIPFLEEYKWEMEEDRWGDLVITVFEGIGVDRVISVKAVELLKELGILTPKDLETLQGDEMMFIGQVFLQAGMEIEESEAAVTVLLKLCRLVNSKWNGYIQKFLRSHGEKMVKELQTQLTRTGIDPVQSKRIATIWLQNVCNLPILLSGDPHIKGFCSRFQMTEAGLINVLDDLGLNACLADDLLAIYAQPNGTNSRPKNTGPKKKSAKKKS